MRHHPLLALFVMLHPLLACLHTFLSEHAFPRHLARLLLPVLDIFESCSWEGVPTCNPPEHGTGA